MDILRAEMERKRKMLADKKLVVSFKVFFGIDSQDVAAQKT